jgi:hypothetical protein
MAVGCVSETSEVKRKSGMEAGVVPLPLRSLHRRASSLMQGLREGPELELVVVSSNRLDRINEPRTYLELYQPRPLRTMN